VVSENMKKSSIVSLVCVCALVLTVVTSCRRSETEKTARNAAKTGSPVAKEELSASNQTVPEESLMRIIAPVRLSSELGDVLDSEVVKAREILQKFDNGGFKYALWAVSELPAAKDIPSWVQTCMRSFPSQAIVAIDTPLGEPLPEESLKLFLQSLKSSTTVHSILLNYTQLSNCDSADNTSEALSALKQRASVVRSEAGQIPVWLLLEDCAKNGDKIPVWTETLGKGVDGYYLQREHSARICEEELTAEVVDVLGSSGKPVIRAGFVHVSPRLRPGLEEDLLENYQDRVTMYEEWISEEKYAGYSRHIGESVPEKVSVNQNYLPPASVAGSD